MIISLDTIKKFDQELLLDLNRLVGNPIVDLMMTLISNKWVWVPFYLVLIYLILREVGLKRWPYLLLAVFGLVLTTDQGSVQFFKDVFERYRPCHNELLNNQLILPAGKCGGLYGFISSHASNVFGVATFGFSVMYSYSKYWSLLFVWAGVVSFSRVYLAVHYPSDVFAGAVFGLVVGLCTSKVFIKCFRS